MPNSYCNLGIIKSGGALKISGNEFDSELVRIAEGESRKIDRYCDRYFYIYEGTKYYDGAATRLILDDDVQTITALIVDTDGNFQYPTTSAYTIDMNSPTTAPDAFAYPTNTLPKTRLEANPNGGYGHLGAGYKRAVKLTGTFGYGNDYPASYSHVAASALTAAITSTSATVNITASTASEMSGGMTLKINSEQVYIGVPTGSSCPIARAVNGTTAAAATSGTAISIYDYPAPIVQACLIQTVRSWKRRESGYVDTIINTDFGSMQLFKGLDKDVAEAIKLYRRMRIPSYF